MTDTLLTLGQQAPAANTLTALYTVPGATSATVSTIFVCNRAAAPTSFRIAIAPAGAADALAQYLYYDTPLPGSDTFTVTAGLTLAATDVIRVQSASGSVSFQAFGVQIT